MKITPPEIFRPLYESNTRYYFLKGGRGSAKSWAAADYILFTLIQNENLNVVCLREIQRSIKHSSKKLLEDRIEYYQLFYYFEIQDQEIKCKNGTGVIIFQGLQNHTVDSIKSLEGFDLCWTEEAQTISAHSLELLTPTIRAENSKLLFTYNQRFNDDPVVKLEDEQEDKTVIFANYHDNPFCPTPIIEEAEQMRKNDYDRYKHVFLGGYQTVSDAQVFRDKFVIDYFEINKTFGDPLHGLDFGFAQDPTAAVRCYIKANTLYISHEACKVGLELDDTSEYIKRHIPGIEKYVIPADSARPESISYLQRHGLPMITGVEKWSGSIEDGIVFIRSFDKVIIHPDCTYTADEFSRYAFKIDKRTDDILPDVVDANNHIIDAIRYALSKLIKNRMTSYSFKLKGL